MTNPSTAVAQHGDLATHPVAILVDSPERVRAWVPLHLLGIAVASFQHKENLVRGMIDGYKRK